jgi:hypothetical protein
VAGHALDCGHYLLPEEAPDETYRALRAFFLPCHSGAA